MTRAARLSSQANLCPWAHPPVLARTPLSLRAPPVISSVARNLHKIAQSLARPRNDKGCTAVLASEPLSLRAPPCPFARTPLSFRAQREIFTRLLGRWRSLAMTRAARLSSQTFLPCPFARTPLSLRAPPCPCARTPCHFERSEKSSASFLSRWRALAMTRAARLSSQTFLPCPFERTPCPCAHPCPFERTPCPFERSEKSSQDCSVAGAPSQ